MLTPDSASGFSLKVCFPCAEMCSLNNAASFFSSSWCSKPIDLTFFVFSSLFFKVYFAPSFWFVKTNQSFQKSSGLSSQNNLGHCFQKLEGAFVKWTFVGGEKGFGIILRSSCSCLCNKKSFSPRPAYPICLCGRDISGGRNGVLQMLYLPV